MSKSKKTYNTFSFPIIAGTSILTNAVLLGVVAKWFIGIMPTLPGSSSNDPAVFYCLSTLGVIFGFLVLIGALILQRRPQRGRTLGMIILIFSASSVIMGGGFLVGFILGIVGGINTLRMKPEVQK